MHNVQMGDIIYKINGVVTKTRSFNYILDTIRSSLFSINVDGDSNTTQGDGVTFIFERQLQKNEPVQLSPSKNNCNANKDYISKSSYSVSQNHPRTLKKTTRRLDHLSSPSSVDVSREVNVLESIFHRRKMYGQQEGQNSVTSDDVIDNDMGNTDGMLQNFQQKEEPSSSALELVAIPECKSLGQG